MNDKYRVIIVDLSTIPTSDIAHYDVPNHFGNNLGSIIEGYKIDNNQEKGWFKSVLKLSDDEFFKIFRELICYLNTHNFTYEEGEQEFSAIITAKNQEIYSLKLQNKQLIEQNNQLIQDNNKFNKNKLQQDIRDLNFELQEKNKQIKKYISYNEELTGQINSISKELRSLHNKYNRELQQANTSVNYWRSQITAESQRYQTLNDKYEQLKKDEKTLQTEKEAIGEKLRDAQEKLGLATTRLHQQTINPVIAGGGSRSDQLKNEFENLKRGLFHNVSGTIFNSWKQQDPELKSFRSEEFLKIKSILSQRVFIDGMSYFADKSEVDKITESFISELLVEGINLDSSASQKIEEKIKYLLLDAKGVDNSNEALTEHIKTTTQIIQDNLKEIRDFSLSDNVLQEIKNFVEEGLKLVQKIVNESSSSEFYTPKAEAIFDENIHEPENYDEGKIKFTICPGYRILETVLVKADVFTYVPDTPEISAPIPSKLNNENENRESTQDESSVNQIQQTEQCTEDSQTETEENNNNLYGGSIDSSEKREESKDIYRADFTGKIIPKSGIKVRSRPNNSQEYRSETKLNYQTPLHFEAWTYSENMSSTGDKPDFRWYKVAGQKDWWVPGAYIEGEPPNAPPIPTNEE
jgi:hypothetical protein